MPSLKGMANQSKNDKNPVSRNRSAKGPSSSSNLSTEFIEESEEDNDKSSTNGASSHDGSLPAGATPTFSKINGKGITAMGSISSGSGSESAEESASGDNEEQGESASEDSEDEEESVPSAKRFKPAAAAPRQTHEAATPPTVAPKTPSPYEAPEGFEASSIDADSNSSKLFKKSNLEGKQIWYITAPASVSIASIEQISLRDIKKGKKVLSHNGNDYGFMQDSTEDKTYTQILAPSSSNAGYHAVSKPMDQILHLQRIVRLPGMGRNESFPSRATVPAKKPVRLQPKVLKMRFRPIGFGEGKTGTLGSSSSSSDGTSSGLDEDMQGAPISKHGLISPVEDSSTTSDEASDEESSSSDVVMTDAPPQPPKVSYKSVDIAGANGLSKGKHSDAKKRKAKNSSSQSTITTDPKQLKRIKTKQTEYHESLLNSQSASTERQKAASMLSPQHTPKASGSVLPPKTPTSKSNTDVLPSSASRSTFWETPVLPPASSTIRFTVKSTPIPPPRKTLPPSSSEVAGVHSGPMKPGNDTPSRDSKSTISLEQQIAAIDSNLSVEDRREEVRRLKRNESSRISKAKRRNLTKALVQSKIDVKVTPTPPPLQSLGTNLKSLVATSFSKPESQESMESKERSSTKEKKRQKKLLSTDKVDPRSSLP